MLYDSVLVMNRDILSRDFAHPFNLLVCHVSILLTTCYTAVSAIFFFFVDWIVWRLSVPLRVSWPISSWNWSRKAFTLPQFSHVVHWGLVHDSGNLNPQLFPSGYGFCPQVSGESGYFLISSLDWKIINPQRLRVDRNIFESGKKKLQIKNRYACTTVTATTTII